MLTIPRNVQVGTKVKEKNNDKWFVVIEISGNRKYLKVENNYGSSWQRGHVVRYTNRTV
jgi:hypothetical protein